MTRSCGRLGVLLLLAGVAAGQPVIEGRREPPLLAITALVDGSDRLEITAAGLRWHHRHWQVPQHVRVNGQPWDVHAQPLLSFEALGIPVETRPWLGLRLAVRHARDLVALERTVAGVDVHLADTPGGSHVFFFELYHPSEEAPPPPAGAPAAPRTDVPDGPRLPDALRVAGVLDNRLTLRLDAAGLHVVPGPHQTVPTMLVVNGRRWQPADGPLRNAGATRFLAPVAVRSALVAERRTRDVATVAVDDDALVLQFADCPPGAAPFDLTVVFPARRDPPR